jgi:4-amino-4-deoxychorismate lyase
MVSVIFLLKTIMTPVILIDGKKQSKAGIFNRNTQFGDGLFETCLVENKKLLFWSNHFERMKLGCDRLKISMIDETLWLSDIKKAFSLMKIDNCIVKLVLSRGESLRGYSYKDNIRPIRITIVSELKKNNQDKGFSLEFCNSGYNSNPKLAGIKHCNRLEQVIARAGIKVDDGIMLDENENVVSVTQGNIFCIQGNRLITPNLDKCGIEGTRRAVILKIAVDLGFDINIKNLSVAELLRSDEVFISNSIQGVGPVNQIEDFVYSKHKITEIISETLKEKSTEDNSFIWL